MGPQQGQKVFTLQTLPASNEGEYGQFRGDDANNVSTIALHKRNHLHVANPTSIGVVQKLRKKKSCEGNQDCVLILLFHRNCMGRKRINPINEIRNSIRSVLFFVQTRSYVCTDRRKLICPFSARFFQMENNLQLPSSRRL